MDSLVFEGPEERLVRIDTGSRWLSGSWSNDCLGAEGSQFGWLSKSLNVHPGKPHVPTCGAFSVRDDEGVKPPAMNLEAMPSRLRRVGPTQDKGVARSGCLSAFDGCQRQLVLDHQDDGLCCFAGAGLLAREAAVK